MLIRTSIFNNMVHEYIVSWRTMLNKNCRYCNIELTEKNARKRKEVSSGYRAECKLCRNKYERSKTRKKKCEYCGIYCIAKGKRSFCSMLCRFKSYYTVNLENDCWEWRKKWRDKNGYGIFIIGKKTKRAPRIAYELFKGPIMDNLFVCHSCDNPCCVNPNHLWLGTNSDNQLDRINKINNRK